MISLITDKEITIINSILSKGNDVIIEKRKDGAVIIEKKTAKIHRISNQLNIANPK